MPRRTRRAVITGLGAALVGLGGCQGSTAGGDETTTSKSGGGSNSGGQATVSSADVFLRGVSPALKDESPALEISGLPPRTKLQLQTEAMGANGKWVSRATFEVGGGEVSLASHAPTAGDWRRASGTAPIWAMKPGPETVSSYFRPGREYTVTVTASVDGQTVGSVDLLRRQFSPAVSSGPVKAEGLVGHYASPPTNRPRPGVILLHGADGNVMRDEAEMLAARGYHALALKYFGTEEALPDTFVEVPRSYFDEAATWLLEREGVAGDKLGVYGWSAGGEGALFLAGYADWVGAVVAKNASGIATWGFKYGGPADGPKWSVDGEPVPSLDHPGGSSGNPYESLLAAATSREVENVTYPIENSSGPIILVSGDLDAHWPSPRLSGYAVTQLERLDEGGRIEHVTYPKTGHRIPIPTTPTFPYTTGNDVADGATRLGVAQAAADSWSRTLSTYGRLA